MSSVLVGSAYGILELRAAQFDQGVDASLAKLAQLRQAFSQGIPPVTLPPVGGGLPGPLTPRQLPGGQAPDIQKDEQAMLRYASSLAAAQKAQGDLSGAASTYRTVLGQLTPNTIEHNRATAQLASTEAALAKESGSLSTQFTGMLNPLTLATVGIGALIAAAKGAGELAVAGAQAQRTANAFDSLATRAGTTGDVLLGALRKASGGEISDVNLELAATKAEFTGIATSASDFGRLMAIARNNSREFGISTGDAFNKLVDALDRGQVRGLKQIGINIDLKKAEADYAQSIGVTVASLDAEQKRQALVQATLAQGEAQLKKTGGAVDDNASAFERLGAAASNAKDRVSTYFSTALAPAAGALATAIERSNAAAEAQATLNERTLAGTQSYQQYADAITRANNAQGRANRNSTPTTALSQGQFDYAKQLQAQGSSAADATAKVQALQSVFDGLDRATVRYKDTTVTTQQGLDQFSAQILRVATSGAVGRAGVESLVAVYNAHQLSTGELTNALAGLEAQQQRNAEAANLEQIAEDRLTRPRGDATSATIAYTNSLRGSAQASIEDAARKDALQAATALLAEKNKLAVDGFLQLHPAITASAAAAAAAEAGYNPQIQRLIVLAAAAGNAKAQLDALTGKGAVTEGRAERDTPGDIAQGRTAGIQAGLARQAALQQALTNQIDRTGTAAQKVTERQKEYNAAVAQFGVHSAQAVNAQTALIEAQKAAEKAGGRTRVSAAQSTALQLQNVEENSQAQLLKTQREGLERMRDAQQDFDLKRSRSKEDEDEKIRHLFETGQRAAAARERADFAKQQRRDQEDFNIQRQRTIRNNQEATGDISGAAERRTDQIGERAALRGVRPGGASLGAAGTPAIGGGGSAAAARGPQPIAQLSIQGVLNIDGKTAGNAVWPTIQILVDDDLAASIRQNGAPNSTQAALAGTAP